MQYKKEDLCRYRYEQAQNALSSAKSNLSTDIKTSLNRSYYSILYAAKALLAMDGKDAGSHKGLFVVFSREYIKTGILAKEYADIIKEASMIRDKSDYMDFYIVSREEAGQQIENAERFISEMVLYINHKFGVKL
jgi:uncharacterized protein (UPF0332 family)